MQEKLFNKRFVSGTELYLVDKLAALVERILGEPPSSAALTQDLPRGTSAPSHPRSPGAAPSPRLSAGTQQRRGTAARCRFP